MNENIIATQWSEGIPFWFALRTDIVALVTMTAISLFAVLTRDV